jgi:hypothetical protein
MEIHSERFEDASEQDADGLYDYFYSGTLFTFRGAEHGYVARQYEDDTSKASFLSGLIGESRTMLSSIPYDDELFREAVAHLVINAGASKICALVGSGYAPVDLSRAGLKDR